MAATAVIADDERLMREQLKARLAQAWPTLQVIGEAANGEEALSLIVDREPDLVFLDIRMPGLNGIEVARRLAGRCPVVFVTAFDDYAVQAFEEGAIDYLVKPVQVARLLRTATRLSLRLGARAEQLRRDEADPLGRGTSPIADDPGNALLDALARQLALTQPARPHLDLIQASVGNEIRLIPVEQVMFFHADERYTRVRWTDGEVLIRKPIRELLIELDPKRFWQIHRSTLVNAAMIASVQRDDTGKRSVVIRGCEERLELSRSFSQRFRQM